MKLLLNNTKIGLSGYLHVSPANGDNPIDLDRYVDNNECQEIICDEIINYIPITELYKYIVKLETKIAHYGKLIINSVDSKEITKLYFNDVIDTLTYNNIVYGTRTNTWEFKQSVICLDEITSIFNSLNLKILSKKINGYNFIIVGERQ